MASWILLRGLTRESGHWGAFVGQFQAALPGSEVLTLDLPGNGALFTQRSPTRVRDMMEHCRAQLVCRQLTAPYHVLAMSLGAMVAVAWADAYPRELAAQVLINTSMRPFSRFHERLLPANYGTLIRLAVLGGTPEEWEGAVLRLTANDAHPDVTAHWLALGQAHPVSRANALRQLLAASRFHAPARQPNVPTLVLASTKDRLVSVECSRALARQWQCPLRLHPTAGHDLPLDDGPWVAAQVCELLVPERCD
ncbi:alpha/beta fold hydrolase [Rhodoferax sp.]|uniref:alpha/beta fold hydrolase n=1 Tax=Rhodoferax sp. TaxID=50421 RepID=UPI0027538F47|nr:alpha/beta hydrolase [Rhodoferax sp.]